MFELEILNDLNQLKSKYQNFVSDLTILIHILPHFHSFYFTLWQKHHKEGPAVIITSEKTYGFFVWQ